MVLKVVTVEDNSFEFAKSPLVLLAESPCSNPFLKHSNLSESPLLRLTASEAACLCDELFFVGHRANIPFGFGPVKMCGCGFPPESRT